MKITQKYSHLNGEEYLIVHHKKIYEEIIEVLASVHAEDHKNKISKEKTMKGKALYSPVEINKSIKEEFSSRKWTEKRYSYYITLNRELMEKSLSMNAKEQKKFLIEEGCHLMQGYYYDHPLPVKQMYERLKNRSEVQ